MRAGKSLRRTKIKIAFEQKEGIGRTYLASTASSPTSPDRKNAGKSRHESSSTMGGLVRSTSSKAPGQAHACGDAMCLSPPLSSLLVDIVLAFVDGFIRRAKMGMDPASIASQNRYVSSAVPTGVKVNDEWSSASRYSS